MNRFAASSALVEAWPALLVLAVLILLPVGIAAAATPLVLGGLIGLVLAWRQRRTLIDNPGLRLGVALFACYWLPALISAPDSVVPGKSWSTVAGLLRFLPFVVFAVLRLRDARIWSRLVRAVGAVVALWLLDAWMQAVAGYSIAGASDPGRLSGILGAGNLKLGLVLAVLSPFLLSAAREAFGRPGLILAFVFALVPILLAGERAGWLMYALVVVVFVWREAGTLLRFVGWSVATLLLVGAATLIALRASPAFEVRVERSLLALRGSVQAVDQASAGRLRIWTATAHMIAANPLNGVGISAYRYAYPKYAPIDDYFVVVENCGPDEGACHAHQIVLEVLSETGIAGFALWIAGAILALRAWRRATAATRMRAFAPALALAAMTFPLNTHLRFYSAWWGLLFWWLLALYCSALYANDEET